VDILGRDHAKFLPARGGLGNKRPGFSSVAGRLGGRRTVVKVGEASDGTPLIEVKHEPGQRGKPMANGSSRQFLVEFDDGEGNTKRVVARKWVCPSCGKPVVGKNGSPAIDVAKEISNYVKERYH
jgi:hypothetical protein